MGERDIVPKLIERITSTEFTAYGVQIVSEMNRRDHWRVRVERKQTQQMAMLVAWRNHLQGRKVVLPATIKLTRIGPRALDSDNLISGFKGCRDEIARQLGVNDASPLVTWQYDQMPIGIREYAVKVSIESA